MKNLFYKEGSYEEFINSYKDINNIDLLDSVKNQVSLILDEIKVSKDNALIAFSKKYDNYDCTSINELIYSKEDFKKAFDSYDPKIVSALEYLKQRILKFHSEIPISNWKVNDDAFNTYGQINRPIKRVGLYAPGGTAVYPSSILMTSVLASLAGVEEVMLAFPPSDIEITNLMLATAHIGGVTEAIGIGGAQSIGAMAYGTESIKKVDKIFGPGNQYVAEAKRQVYGLVGIDSLTGPSEVMIIADKSANPEFIAADLLAQAEHGANSACHLIVIEKGVKEYVLESLEIQLKNTIRSAMARESLSKYSYLIEVQDIKDAEKICNLIHPEHLQIAIENINDINLENFSAGAIFAGTTNSAVFGDYCAGPSHVIPTNGASRFSSQVSLRDFYVTSSFSKIAENFDSDELDKVIDNSIEIAELEGLYAHAEALRLRKNKLSSN
jgi:histidinol dehydrogenase